LIDGSIDLLIDQS